MRPREVGGYEPDDTEQTELHELWRHSPGVAGYERTARLNWVIGEFLRVHAGQRGVAHKWIYVWGERHLGRILGPDPVEIKPWTYDGS